MTFYIVSYVKSIKVTGFNFWNRIIFLEPHLHTCNLVSLIRAPRTFGNRDRIGLKSSYHRKLPKLLPVNRKKVGHFGKR